MGALGSVTGMIGTALTAVNTVSRAVDLVTGQSQEEQALEQLKAQQRLAQQQAQNDADLQAQKISADAATEEARRKQALKRAVAKQKTLFAAQGLTGGGSADAVLLGLFEESEAERKEREQIDALKKQALTQNLEQQKQKDLLSTTQRAERSNLERIISGG